MSPRAKHHKTQDKTRYNVKVFELCAADKIARELWAWF